MNAVVDTPELRAQYNANQPRITAFWTELSQNEALYARFKALAALDRVRALAGRAAPSHRKRAARLPSRGSRTRRPSTSSASGACASASREISTRFAENVLDATNAFALYITDASELAGVPDDALQMFREAAQRRRPDRLQDHAAVPELFGDPRLRRRSLAARTALSRLCDACLGSRQPGLEQRPADGRAGPAAAANTRQPARLRRATPRSRWSPRWPRARTRCCEFLRDLGAAARPYAQRDIDELREFAAQQLGIAELMPWDFSYASEKLREARYSYSDQELKLYFSEPRVLGGPVQGDRDAVRASRSARTAAPTWHPDVRFYRIENAARRTGRPVLSRPVRARAQAGRRLAGRCAQPPRPPLERCDRRCPT